jgi:uncharacterized protein (TIGR00255 family)
MTGYGRSRRDTELGMIDVEIRTVNHRYADLGVKLPRDLHGIEDRVKTLIAEKIKRGRVNINVLLDPAGEQKPRMCIDKEALQDHLKVFEEMKFFHKIAGEIDLKLLAGFPDLFSRTVPTLDEDQFWASLEPIMSEALSDCVQMRAREGERLGEIVTQSLSNVETLVSDVEDMAPARMDKVRERLKKAVSSLTEGTDIEDSRVMYEVSLLAEKWDVTEEIERIKSHLELFREYLGEGGVLGRRLTFMSQELHREANTISSKANDSAIVQKVVLMKEEVEKIREQLENLE